MNKHTNRVQAQTREISLFPLITASGFAAAVAQIVLLRELMVLCYGIELCMGVTLAAWLVGSALGCTVSVRFRPRHRNSSALPGAMLILAAIVLPLTLLFIRAAGLFTGALPGELPPLPRLVPVCIGATLPFSFLSGALFALCWNAAKKTAGVPISIYVGEALGAAAGGILFYILVACRQSALTILLATALGLLFSAAWFFRSRHPQQIRTGALALIGLFAAVVTAGLIFRADIELASRRMQWGADFIASRDTPYQNLVLLRKGEQISVFSNGLWLFSAPDPMSREWAVHPALLMHPAPESVLLLGGGARAGLTEEILRHPGVMAVDVVELDPAMTTFASGHIPETANSPEAGSEGPVTLHYGDAAEFIRSTHRRWDVILMNLGDPVNAQMNRFYTVSFFSAVKDRLADGGIFSFGVSGSQEMLGEVQIAFLGAMRRTLARVFPNVSVLPGNPVRFFATGSGGRLADDPQTLIDRMHQRDLALSHVREDTLRDRFEAFRRRYFNNVLEESDAGRINRDFSPLCYAHALGLWSAQWHSRLGSAVAAMTRIGPGTVWAALLLICGICLLFFRIRNCRPRAAVGLSVGTVGGVTIGVQMALLIVFQILQGALFLHLALIVALFMAGLAIGAGWVTATTSDTPSQSGRLLVRLQAASCLFPILLAGVFLLLHSPLLSAAAPTVPALFSGMSLLTGILGGAHFAASSKSLAVLGEPASIIGGRLYGIDLAGAATCLLLATFLIIPALGPIHLLPMLSAAAVTGLLPLYRRV